MKNIHKYLFKNDLFIRNYWDSPKIIAERSWTNIMTCVIHVSSIRKKSSAKNSSNKINHKIASTHKEIPTKTTYFGIFLSFAN